LASPSGRVKDVIVPALPPQQWIVEHKLDGSLANFTIGKGRAVFHSHRPTGETYYDGFLISRICTTTPGSSHLAS